ncbi:L-arabinose isomerase [Shouchella clausii]|uniref:L-arabinose isomerase n=4 Tax=Bacteria TaxID=2 RepID=ARAA_SHOC1|nr:MULTISPECIES: L-arabinose isomerase [Shouchella]Q5WL05.1 RecName: Full=L-arabinose isomerase [Shouchella clausii KSM-K16]MCM3314363.1 L-arabinose isomerase [Psychrobacillus sp. MER TA 17]ALA52473.1 L-arabinose isomerase [Shouchella clausii]MBU3230111.1 L-arabinose isomerase [Shouchella clausii]MBU3262690.1 L-arabinose isomerase [Shouchella clausii]MBU3506994.1 L-arabinose isomerase [Shouchella clausii]
MHKQGKYQFWFITGSQPLYGQEALDEVAAHSKAMVERLKEKLPEELVLKPVASSPERILELFRAANGDNNCAGIITWMHTFSPAKMWIAGLNELNKPMLHFHTQYNRDIPWGDIDMDFMNLNQSAHGDREFGFMVSRMNIDRKVVAGHWQDARVMKRIGDWMKTVNAYQESKQLKIARFGDNMREVAVTEGDKVEAQIKLGWSVSGFGIGDLVEVINSVSTEEVNALMDEYRSLYTFHRDANIAAVEEQARIEIGIERFLQQGDFRAFSTTFEDLHGMKQLPGLAVQRLMAKGYGFAGEGDWKTAALLRVLKVLAGNVGTSFMEDYTNHLEPGQEMILGSHMLEVCPTISAQKPEIVVAPLSMGNREDPARLVFKGKAGRALNAALIDMGSRFRLVANEVEAVENPHDMPKLPVASVLWKPLPSFSEATEAWIYAGGAHHTVFSYEISKEQLADWASLMGIECIVIDDQSNVGQVRKELFWNRRAY